MADDIITGIILILFAAVIYVAGKGRFLELIPMILNEKLKDLSDDGIWLQDGDYITCSKCEKVWNIIDNDTETFDYCPGCGSKMRDEERGHTNG